MFRAKRAQIGFVIHVHLQTGIVADRDTGMAFSASARCFAKLRFRNEGK